MKKIKTKVAPVNYEKLSSVLERDTARQASNMPESAATPLSRDSEGLYRDLEALLRTQIKTKPDDVRPMVKLLELYAEMGSREGFLDIARDFRARHREADDPETWETVARMGRRLLPREQLFMTMEEGLEFDAGEETVAADQHQRIGEQPEFSGFFSRLAADYEKLRSNQSFVKQLDTELRRSLDRPSSLMHAQQLSKQLGGARIYLKREDLSPQHSHLGISVAGQALVAQKLGRKTLVTSSANGYRGVVSASTARRMGLNALVFVDREVISRHPGNLRRLTLMGAEVAPIDMEILSSGDLREAALEYCVRDPQHSFLVMGLDGAPQPYPQMVTEAVASIGREVLRQMYAETQRLPDLMVARAGDNADAIGFFAPFLGLKSTRLACVASTPELIDIIGMQVNEPYGRDFPMHQARDRGKLRNAKRILEGLEYPGVRREHAWLSASGRVEYPEVTVAQVRQAVRDFSLYEGIIPALETAHALAYACQVARYMSPEESVVVLVAERVDKDIPQLDTLIGDDPLLPDLQ